MLPDETGVTQFVKTAAAMRVVPVLVSPVAVNERIVLPESVLPVSVDHELVLPELVSVLPVLVLPEFVSVVPVLVSVPPEPVEAFPVSVLPVPVDPVPVVSVDPVFVLPVLVLPESVLPVSTLPEFVELQELVSRAPVSMRLPVSTLPLSVEPELVAPVFSSDWSESICIGGLESRVPEIIVSEPVKVFFVLVRTGITSLVSSTL